MLFAIFPQFWYNIKIKFADVAQMVEQLHGKE